MKIAFFQFFPETLWTPGGGESQLASTRIAIERRGIEVCEFNTWSRSLDFDVMHVFGSTYELSSFVSTLKSLGKPVVSTVISFSNKPNWQWRLWSTVDRIIPVPTIYRLRQQIYRSADCLVAGSRAEANQLNRNFDFDSSKLRVVPQGIDVEIYRQAKPDRFIKKLGFKNFVLQVGRISHHKGQLRLIEAMDSTKTPLVFIGPLDPSDSLTATKFLDSVKARPWVHYLGALPANDPLLVSAYAAAQVHALPSLVESLGLVTLEAAAAGASVVTGDYAPIHEYLGDRADYCDPNSVSSIREAVLKAMQKRENSELATFVGRQFSWDQAAEKLIKIYQETVQASKS